jgi:hypothetical protein
VAEEARGKSSLRADKQEFIDKLRSGELETTPARLNLACHIANNPECECEVCGKTGDV